MAKGKMFLVKGQRPRLKIEEISKSPFSLETKSGLSATGATDIFTTHLIPEELIDGLVAGLGNRAKRLGRPEERDAVGGVFRKAAPAQLTQEAINQVSREVGLIPHMHLAYYRATLNGIQKFLNDPDLPMRQRGTYSPNIPVNLNLSQTGSYGIWTSGFRTIYVDSRKPWQRLKKSTVAEKRKLGKKSQTFWRHTGKLSRVFDAARRQQLSGLTAADFTGKVTRRPVFLKEIGSIERKKLGKGRFAREAKLTVEVGVPTWRDSGQQYMDVIITQGFAGVSPGSVNNFFSLRGKQFGRDGFKTPLQRLQEARSKTSDRVEGNFYELFHVSKRETSLRRVLAPESSRPILTRFAIIAGAQLRYELRTLYR